MKFLKIGIIILVLLNLVVAIMFWWVPDVIESLLQRQMHLIHKVETPQKVEPIFNFEAPVKNVDDINKEVNKEVNKEIKKIHKEIEKNIRPNVKQITIFKDNLDLMDLIHTELKKKQLHRDGFQILETTEKGFVIARTNDAIVLNLIKKKLRKLNILFFEETL